MELLLTGSTGFVGRNLLLRLADDRRWSRIILPVRDPGKLRAQLAGEGIPDEGRFLILRVTGNFWELPGDISPDLVIHAAGLLFGRLKEEYLAVNVEGSIRLAAQLPRKARMIVLSSMAAGGPTPPGVSCRTGDHEDRPVSLYGASKLVMERELGMRLGRRLMILRPPMVLGPRDAATLPLFRMAAGAVRIKPGFSSKHYSWIDVGDLCDAILDVAVAGSWDQRGPFYPGSHGIITDRELIATAAAVLGSKGITVAVPQTLIRLTSLAVDAVPSWRASLPSLGRDRVREILPGRWVADGSGLGVHYGWSPRRTLRESLSETAAWLRNQGSI